MTDDRHTDDFVAALYRDLEASDATQAASESGDGLQYPPDADALDSLSAALQLYRDDAARLPDPDPALSQAILRQEKLLRVEPQSPLARWFERLMQNLMHPALAAVALVLVLGSAGLYQLLKAPPLKQAPMAALSEAESVANAPQFAKDPQGLLVNEAQKEAKREAKPMVGERATKLDALKKSPVLADNPSGEDPTSGTGTYGDRAATKVVSDGLRQKPEPSLSTRSGDRAVTKEMPAERPGAWKGFAPSEDAPRPNQAALHAPQKAPMAKTKAGETPSRARRDDEGAAIWGADDKVQALGRAGSAGQLTGPDILGAVRQDSDMTKNSIGSGGNINGSNIGGGGFAEKSAGLADDNDTEPESRRHAGAKAKTSSPKAARPQLAAADPAPVPQPQSKPQSKAQAKPQAAPIWGETEAADEAAPVKDQGAGFDDNKKRRTKARKLPGAQTRRGTGKAQRELNEMDRMHNQRRAFEQLNAGKKAYSQHRYDEALGMFVRAEQLYPGGPLGREAVLMQARSLYRLKSYKDAATIFRRVLAQTPGRDDENRIAEELAACYERSGQSDMAARTRRQYRPAEATDQASPAQ